MVVNLTLDLEVLTQLVLLRSHLEASVECWGIGADRINRAHDDRFLCAVNRRLRLRDESVACPCY